MNFFETLYNRHSVRTYTGEAPTDEQLAAILKAGRAAPVANARYDDLQITVIRRRGLIQGIQDYISQLAGEEKRPFFDAPVLLLISMRTREETPANSEYSSAAIVAHNMSLAATQLGLGTCLVWGAINLANEDAEIVRQFELPEGHTTLCSVTLGQTDEAFEERVVPEGKIAVTTIE